jgi:hypothetical protein
MSVVNWAGRLSRACLVLSCALCTSSVALAQVALTNASPLAGKTRKTVGPGPTTVTVAKKTYYPYRFEGHVHTHHSLDARQKVVDVLQSAEAAGLDAVVITDHGTSKALREFDQYKGPLVPFVGREIGGDFGHAVIWHSSEDDRFVSSKTSLQQRCDWAHKYGGLLVWAHPGWWIEGNDRNPLEWMTPAALRRKGAAGDIDAIELWNGMYRGPLPKLIDLWLRVLEAGVFVPIVGNSDFHRFGASHIGSAHSIAFCDKADVSTCLWPAVREGRIVVSDGPFGFISVEDKIPGQIVLGPKRPLHVEVDAQAPDGGTLQVYLGRQIVHTLKLEPGVRATARWDLPLPSADTYVRMDILRPERRKGQTPISLMSNPVLIDVGPPRTSWR